MFEQFNRTRPHFIERSQDGRLWRGEKVGKAKVVNRDQRHVPQNAIAVRPAALSCRACTIVGDVSSLPILSMAIAVAIAAVPK